MTIPPGNFHGSVHSLAPRVRDPSLKGLVLLGHLWTNPTWSLILTVPDLGIGSHLHSHLGTRPSGQRTQLDRPGQPTCHPWPPSQTHASRARVSRGLQPPALNGGEAPGARPGAQPESDLGSPLLGLQRHPLLALRLPGDGERLLSLSPQIEEGLLHSLPEGFS